MDNHSGEQGDVRVKSMPAIPIAIVGGSLDVAGGDTVNYRRDSSFLLPIRGERGMQLSTIHRVYGVDSDSGDIQTNNYHKGSTGPPLATINPPRSHSQHTIQSVYLPAIEDIPSGSAESIPLSSAGYFTVTTMASSMARIEVTGHPVVVIGERTTVGYGSTGDPGAFNNAVITVTCVTGTTRLSGVFKEIV